jgi:hypothetical protein
VTRNRHGGVEAVNADGENSNSDDSELETSVDNGLEEDILTLRDYLRYFRQANCKEDIHGEQLGV